MTTKFDYEERKKIIISIIVADFELAFNLVMCNVCDKFCKEYFKTKKFILKCFKQFQNHF